MTITIAQIVPGDYSQTITVIKKSIRKSLGKIYPDKLIEDFCHKYDLDSFKVKAQEISYFVAKDNGRILGIIGLKNNQLRTFYVDPDFQGQGIGRKLYDRLESEAKSLGIKTLQLEGSPLGEPIYLKFGFHKIGSKVKERVGVKYTDALMEKSLQD